MAQFLRFSLFPLQVTVTDNAGEKTFEHYKSRIVVTDDEVYVYTDGQNGQVETAFNDRLLDFTGTAKTGWTATTEDGDTVSFIRSSACSCGSRLKGFNPFPGLPFEERL